MLRHLLQVNKKKGKRCRFLSDLISYVSKSDNTAAVSVRDLALHPNRPIFFIVVPCILITLKFLSAKNAPLY